MVSSRRVASGPMPPGLQVPLRGCGSSPDSRRSSSGAGCGAHLRRTRAMALVAAVAGLLAMALALPVRPAAALTLAQKKAAAQARVEKVKAQLDALNVSLERAGQEYDQALVQLDAVQKRLQKTSQDLKVAEYRLAVARQNLAQRAVAMYKQQPTDIVDVLFSAQSFSNMVDEIKTMQELSANDSRIVDEVHAAADAVKQKRDRLVVDREQARKLVARVKEKKDGIAAALAQRQHILDTAKAEVKKIEHQEAVAAARAAARARAAALAAAQAAAAAARANTSVPATPYVPTPGTNAGPGHPEVIAIAQRYLGVPYLYGGASPATGFDCSGLVMYCYAQIGIHLTHYSGAQQHEGVPVSMNALMPGDLVFEGYPVSYHVALYAGGGMVIEAPHTGAVVSYSSVSRFQYAVRIP
jgi:cell wall-associated NlpC family hydrolase